MSTPATAGRATGRATTSRPASEPDSARPALTGGVLLGVGLGGLFDGIVLHQLLQWHHMLTDHGDYADRFPPGTVTDLQDNTLADGLFHVAALVLTVVGMAMLYRAARRGWTLTVPTLIGALLAGWGLFNIVEGLVDHHLLSVHHVRDDVADPLWWDVGFLALGVALVVVGLLLVRSGTTLRNRDGRVDREDRAARP